METLLGQQSLAQVMSVIGMVLGVILTCWGVRSAFVLRGADEDSRVRTLSGDRAGDANGEGSEVRSASSKELKGASRSLADDVLVGYRTQSIIGAKLMVRMSAAVVLACLLAFGMGRSWGFLVAVAVLVPSMALLIEGAMVRRASAAVTKEIDFFLPIVMERIVMAVEAGIDVFPAIKRVVEIEVGDTELKDSRVSSRIDPVTKLLELVVTLVESGRRFEDALKDVAAGVHSSALKHAFVHLSVATQEGGEVVKPLRELSDATQLYFQEQVEEEIATMPVRATLPLLSTFAGLILFFITAPLMQVLGMMSEAMPK